LSDIHPRNAVTWFSKPPKLIRNEFYVLVENGAA
jgi:hypothetical protein